MGLAWSNVPGASLQAKECYLSALAVLKQNLQEKGGKDQELEEIIADIEEKVELKTKANKQ